MFYYVKIQNGRAVSFTGEYPSTTDTVDGVTRTTFDRTYENRNDWKTFARVEEIAAQLTESTDTVFLPVDHGRGCSPQFDIVAAPVVGYAVSKAFNGDSYPAGTITKVSATLKRVETDTGEVFFRRGKSSLWIEGRTWAMIPREEPRRNPSF